MIFLDTSVLVAIAHVNHEGHPASRALWNTCSAAGTAVSVQALAELYGALTAMPPALCISPRNAVLAVETFLKRLTPVELTGEEYLETLRRTASLGYTGGMICDVLHLACARKVDARRIYTWNVRHFHRAAPDLKERILTP